MAQDSHDWKAVRPASRKPLRITSPTSVWVCCKELCEVVIHWTGGRSLPCDVFFGSETCELCLQELPRLKEYWLLVADYRPRGQAVLVKITPGAVETSPNLLKHNGDLYGRLLYLSRMGGTVRSPMLARLIQTEDFVTLPEPQDVLARLRRMWGAPDKKQKGGGS